MHFIVESLLVDILHKKGYGVQQVTEGHTEDKPSRPASPKRKAINARDIQSLCSSLQALLAHSGRKMEGA